MLSPHRKILNYMLCQQWDKMPLKIGDVIVSYIAYVVIYYCTAATFLASILNYVCRKAHRDILQKWQVEVDAILTDISLRSPALF